MTSCLVYVTTLLLSSSQGQDGAKGERGEDGEQGQAVSTPNLLTNLLLLHEDLKHVLRVVPQSKTVPRLSKVFFYEDLNHVVIVVPQSKTVSMFS